MPTVLTLRATKGTPLTNQELDDNFSSLNDNKLEKVSPAVTTSLTTPSSTFDLLNTTATAVNAFGAATALSMGANSGTTTVNNDFQSKGNLVGYASSDLALKDDIMLLGNALDRVKQLRGVSWTWKADKVSDAVLNSPTVGVIAQDVEQVLPEVVITRPDGTKSVNYDHMIGLLVEAIKELNSKVSRLSPAGV